MSVEVEDVELLLQMERLATLKQLILTPVQLERGPTALSLLDLQHRLSAKHQ